MFVKVLLVIQTFLSTEIGKDLATVMLFKAYDMVRML